MSARSVLSIVESTRTTEGEGFRVHRPFPTRSLMDFDPFLLLDEMGPSDLGPGEAKGAPDHPHRGFETVTYLLEGNMVHKDSRGNTGKLTPGDVQWMTAGAGVVHSEMPDPEFKKSGGRLHGFQLWVNLPRRDKMIKPRYQDTPSGKIPTARTEDGRVSVRVIAGEALGCRAVIDTRTPILYLHFSLESGARIEQPIPDGFNAFAYVIGGKILAGPDDRPAKEHQMVLFSREGDRVSIAASEAAHFLLIAGQPLGEPVARHGPFVMNTEEEIEQAFADYQNGKMGMIA